MPPLVVESVRSARVDLLRAIDGVDDATGALRLGGLNEVAWMVAHLAEQEQRYWLEAFGARPVRPDVHGYRRARPDAVMPLSEAVGAWRQVTAATEGRLQSFGPEDEARHPPEGAPVPPEPIGTLALRVFGHIYLHVGQITAVRRWLGLDVPTFVGRLPGAPAAR